MIRNVKIVAAAMLLPAVAGCSTMGAGTIDRGVYQLVGVRTVSVGNGSVLVAPPRPWNKQRRLFFDSLRWVEDWTLNGPLLDSMMFVTALPDRRRLVQQRGTEERQVPRFRSDMLAPEIASMLESAYRVRGGAVEFETLGLQPRQFLGHPGFQFDFEHLDTDEVRRRGRAVGAVINGRLYLVMLDAARSHYFQNALADFEAVVTNARLRR